MIRVIGIDIPRGWAVVDVPSGGISTIHDALGVALGELDEGREVEHFTTLLHKYDCRKIAIETPLEPYVHGRGGAGKGEGARRAIGISLIACARLAGRIEQHAIALGLPVIVTDADTVRKALGIGGKTETERDRAVKQYVKTVVRGWPARSNADERDAAVVAVYGGMAR